MSIDFPDSERSRRALLLGILSIAAGACRSRSQPTAGALPELERQLGGGRLGVFALDTGSGRTLAQREDERFAMCSTFKWALSAAILAEVQANRLSLQERLSYGEADLLEYAPTTRAHVGEGSMTVEALAEASITVSDNIAANLLLSKLGGPAELTRFFRQHGDTTSRLDRTEPMLNTNLPGDARDTTTPRAMVGLMRRLLCGDALDEPRRELLLRWLRATETGKKRLRAGFPAHFLVGDKTGTGNHGAVNDVAIAIPKGRPPILIAAYASGGSASLDGAQLVHAGVAELVSRELS
jgi:beta-lactamase class A